MDAACTSVAILHCQPEEEGAAAAGQERGDGEEEERPAASAQRGSCAVLVRTFRSTFTSPQSLCREDVVVACCWATDGSRMAAAFASGHVYVLDRCACR